MVSGCVFQDTEKAHKEHLEGEPRKGRCGPAHTPMRWPAPCGRLGLVVGRSETTTKSLVFQMGRARPSPHPWPLQQVTPGACTLSLRALLRGPTQLPSPTAEPSALPALPDLRSLLPDLRSLRSLGSEWRGRGMSSFPVLASGVFHFL